MNKPFKKTNALRNTHHAIRVMVVDNSIFMRQLVGGLLHAEPDIKVVAKAKSGEEALELIPTLKPDVITLDIEMPGMDGLETLRKIMAVHPSPVIMLSAYSREGADITIECLEEGAVSFILKPSGEMSLDIAKVKDQLLAEIRAAAGVDVRKAQGARRITHHPSRIAHHPSRITHYEKRIIVIGASTGGTLALEAIASALPSNFTVPLVMVLHMPSKSFTQSFAKRLNDQCALEVKEAEHHESLYPGFVYVAPGGYHLSMEAKSRRGDATWFVLTPASTSEASPSIDITMQSVAKFYQEKTVGVILTGMGNDGCEGMKEIKKFGGQTIAQDEESSLIFGMPHAVIESGYADSVMPLSEIGYFLAVGSQQKPTAAVPKEVCRL